MMSCPKCGSSDISGPKYESAAVSWIASTVGNMGEWLRYTCKRCGYSKTSPTRDAEKRSRER